MRKPDKWLGKYPVQHQPWCPSLSNRYRKVREYKGVVEYEPVGERFACLCNNGRSELSDPRPEVVEAAVGRYRERHRPRGLIARLKRLRRRSHHR